MIFNNYFILDSEIIQNIHFMSKVLSSLCVYVGGESYDDVISAIDDLLDQWDLCTATLMKEVC